MDYAGRIVKVRGYLARHRIPSLAVSDLPNIFYLTGLREVEGVLMMTGKDAVFFASPLYHAEAVSAPAARQGLVTIERFSPDALKTVVERSSRVGIFTAEVSAETFLRWKEKYAVECLPLPNFMRTIRAIKEEAEILVLKRAHRMAHRVMRKIRGLLRTGMTELDIAGEIHYHLRRMGGCREAFAPVVAAGPNAAYPHHRPTRRRIREGEPVVVDLGVDVAGYKSDITWTLSVGALSPKFKRISALVRETRDSCIGRIAPGRKTAALYRYAVALLRREGYDRYFVHGLGHGVGIEIHEDPGLRPVSGEVFRKGMVVTVEPGVYLPGEGGVRWEETVFV